MAYLNFAQPHEAALALNTVRPVADPMPASLSPLEWSVVALAQKDRLSSIDRPGRISMAMGRLFGHRRNPDLADPRLEGLVRGPWIIQPVVESVRTVGESSVYVLGGVAVAQVDKVPAAGEVRVHELYGGRSVPVPLDPVRAGVAAEAVGAVERRTGAELAYARVDLMAWQDDWVVSELELIEPFLYLSYSEGAVERYYRALEEQLGNGSE